MGNWQFDISNAKQGYWLGEAKLDECTTTKHPWWCCGNAVVVPHKKKKWPLLWYCVWYRISSAIVYGGNRPHWPHLDSASVSLAHQFVMERFLLQYFSSEHPTVLLTLDLFLNSASAQNLHSATPLPCQSQGSHRGQSWIGMDRVAVCQTDGPIPRSAAARTAPLSSASWGSPAHCGHAH